MFDLLQAVVGEADHPALAWRRAGLQALTGQADGPGLVCPVAVSTIADGAVMALRTLAPEADLPHSGAALLGERARLLGFRRQGATSANGSARLLDTRDGAIVLNLPRPDDWASLPALLGEPADDWVSVAAAVARHDTAALVVQGRLLGMAIAPDGDRKSPQRPFEVETVGPPRHGRAAPLVVDLSSLWAGPLAGSLLQAAGARVIKVESLGRPDGARSGNAAFFDLLNAGKASVGLDFGDDGDLARLRALIARADIVIESTRPRALAQLGVDARQVAEAGAVWLSITAYGRDGEAASHVGFGDDAAVAGGLSTALRRAWGARVFAGDAIADPLSGVVAAFAALGAWRAGGSRMVGVALADVVAFSRAKHEVDGETVRDWQARAVNDRAPLYPMRSPPRSARRLGADTESVLAEAGVSAQRTAGRRPAGWSRH